MKNFKFIASLLMFVASIVVGGGFVMAEAAITPIAQGGSTISAGTLETGETVPGGILSKKDGEIASPDLFMADVDKRVTKIAQMRTPIDQISRKSGTALKTESLEVTYYSVGNRPIKGEVNGAGVVLSASADRFALPLTDSSMLDVQDTVRFRDINGYKEDGTTEDEGIDFVALVIDVDSSGFRVCQPINGGRNQLGYPAIPSGTKIVRMGRAGAEFDVQTSIFSNVPTPETQYCQKFMMQVEESTWARMNLKEANWGFNDIERDGVEALKVGMEGSFMFGQKRKFKHAINKQMVYTTGGIYYMAGKVMEVGTWNGAKSTTDITDDDLVDITKILFTGEGAGNRMKIGLAGKEALSSFSKIKSYKSTFERKSVEHWGLKFKSFESEFGEVLMMYCEMMDIQGKEDEIFVLDPEYLQKRIFQGWSREEYDMKKLAIRATNAVVLSETSSLYLTNKNAHSILKLKKEA